MSMPKLVVFDLDFTLWDCGGLWVDCTDHPFTKSIEGNVIDSGGRLLRLYDEVPLILRKLEQSSITMALASRTSQPGWAVDLLDLMGIRSRFEYEEIFPDSKVKHFENLASRTGLTYSEMLFFDDEHRNIREVGGMGVRCIEVDRGMTLANFDEGLELFG
tara:strand:+ start:5220 stop:5699 length:480 start_codon:yes stop_codon:yes gene_type:complete